MPSKRGPLSTAEKFYIEEHAKKGIGIGEIAKTLDRTEKALAKVFNTAVANLSTTTTPAPVVAQATPPQETPPKTFSMIHKQIARQGGATVMTPNASMLADERRAQRSIRPQVITTSRNAHCVTQARPEAE